MMRVAIGSDHAGFDFKSSIIKLLKNSGHQVLDIGPFTSESVDYPDYAHPVARTVEKKRGRFWHTYLWKWKWSLYYC